MSDETIHWLRDTASANSTSTSSIDCAKVEAARRREYEKIEQVNRMHMAARALGFPDKISSEVKYKSSYYVIISIHDCFDPEYYKWSRSTAVVVNSHCFFYRFRFEPSDAISLYEQISTQRASESPAQLSSEVPSSILWLLVCMKLFYEKDWDGKKWIDQKDAFTRYEEKFGTTTSICDEMTNVSDIQSELIRQMGEKMAKDIDDEIIKAMKTSDDWKAQIGNVVYHPKKWLGDTVT